MRWTSTAAAASLLAGAASANIFHQQVLGNGPGKPRTETIDELKKAAMALSTHTDDLTAVVGLQSISTEELDVWSQLLEQYPDILKPENLLAEGKKPKQRPASEWDHIVRGEDIQNSWVKNADGSEEREIDGRLDAYTLRAKSVDPSKLGIDNVKQYSGYLDDDKNDKHLFYWFFESRNDPKNDPVILWLNGGPGCSSLTGLFMELGPAMINKKAEPVHNPWSWNNNASVIFLDQPVNTGFSYSGNSVSNSIAAGKDVYALLTLFFKQFPEYTTQDFHIAGESYAGHYIPVFASEILSHKKRNINLKSVLIGNGLTDGLTQYHYYRPMACGKGGWPSVLDQQECSAMDNALPRCTALIQSCYNSESVWSCVPASIYCNQAMFGAYQRSGQNVYDVRGKCADSSSLCYSEIGWINTYLNRKDVQDAIGAEVSNYEGCNFDVNRNFLFQGDWMKPFHRLVPGILSQIPVLVYAGDADYICNWLGNQAWTEALDWTHQSAFKKAKMTPLRIDNEQYGEVKAANGFAFMRLYAAGHMVPYDQPAPSLDMLNRWVSGEWFSKKGLEKGEL